MPRNSFEARAVVGGKSANSERTTCFTIAAVAKSRAYPRTPSISFAPVDCCATTRSPRRPACSSVLMHQPNSATSQCGAVYCCPVAVCTPHRVSRSKIATSRHRGSPTADVTNTLSERPGLLTLLAAARSRLRRRRAPDSPANGAGAGRMSSTARTRRSVSSLGVSCVRISSSATMHQRNA